MRLLRLPADVYLLILGYLPAISLESLRRVCSVLAENTPEGVRWYEPAGKIAYANKLAEDIMKAPQHLLEWAISQGLLKAAPESAVRLALARRDALGVEQYKEMMRGRAFAAVIRQARISYEVACAMMTWGYPVHDQVFAAGLACGDLVVCRRIFDLNPSCKYICEASREHGGFAAELLRDIPAELCPRGALKAAAKSQEVRRVAGLRGISL